MRKADVVLSRNRSDERRDRSGYDDRRKLVGLVQHDIEPASLNRMNPDLAKASQYNLLVQKRITALADIRNKAAHGHSDKFSDADVRDMIVQVEAFVAEALREALAAIRRIPHRAAMDPLIVTLRAAPADCWSCGCETSILSSITIATPLTAADHCVADFTDWPKLMHELAAKLPASAGVGAIKSRMSAAAGGAYMSNGCRHCDALFGRHFEVHTRYDASVVAAFEIVPGPRWQIFLKAQPD